MNNDARRLWMSRRLPRNEAPLADVAGKVATMRLYDPVDSWGDVFGVSAKEFSAALDELPDDVEEIRLHINSPGGEVFEGIAILNALRTHNARVVAVVDGIAASAASFIACGADELIMARNSELMIHDAWGMCVGNAADMTSMASMLGRLSDNIASIYAEKSGGDLSVWRDAMAAESWYSADEAVKAGLADRVDKKKSSAAKDAFDLSMYNFAGRDAAPAPVTDVAAPEVAASEVATVEASDEPCVLDPVTVMRFRHLVASTRT